MKDGEPLQMGHHNLCGEISDDVSQARSDASQNHAPTHPPTGRGWADPLLQAPHQTVALTSATGQREYDEIGQCSPIFSPADREMH